MPDVKCESSSCRERLYEPYIKCAECSQLFCLKCFSHGSETQLHLNTHSYCIIHDNIKVFPTSDWSAKEERLLLDYIRMHGYGNWSDISKAIRTRSTSECHEHYLKHYFKGIFSKVLGLTNEPYHRLTIPYLYRMNSVEPPRQEFDSIYFHSMAGYNAARGDFETPYDNSAESIVSNLMCPGDSSDDEVMNELNCGLFNAYNNRLR